MTFRPNLVHIETEIGLLVAVFSSRGLVRLLFPGQPFDARVDAQIGQYEQQDSDNIYSGFEDMLREYLRGARRKFDVPTDLHGTAFQLDVWNALLRIPYGETRSYAEVAAMIGRPKAVRAVGSANNANPVPIIVPCHRVIGSNGKLVGYGGGLDLKQHLLELEKRAVCDSAQPYGPD